MTGNGQLVSMVYDAFGNRLSKTVTNIAAQTSVTTQYLV
jgi:YD repeat-containing protein